MDFGACLDTIGAPARPYKPAPKNQCDIIGGKRKRRQAKKNQSKTPTSPTSRFKKANEVPGQITWKDPEDGFSDHRPNKVCVPRS